LGKGQNREREGYLLKKNQHFARKEIAVGKGSDFEFIGEEFDMAKAFRSHGVKPKKYVTHRNG
jgi:hypothetical protein